MAVGAGVGVDVGAGVCVAPTPGVAVGTDVGAGVGLGGGAVVNPSGGALCGNPMFAAGLARIGLAAQAVMSGRAGRALGHATSGPALQQNLVCVLDGEAPKASGETG